jgi:hypothetical protein
VPSDSIESYALHSGAGRTGRSGTGGSRAGRRPRRCRACRPRTTPRRTSAKRVPARSGRCGGRASHAHGAESTTHSTVTPVPGPTWRISRWCRREPIAVGVRHHLETHAARRQRAQAVAEPGLLTHRPASANSVEMPVHLGTIAPRPRTPRCSLRGTAPSSPASRLRRRGRRTAAVAGRGQHRTPRASARPSAATRGVFGQEEHAADVEQHCPRSCHRRTVATREEAFDERSHGA